MSPQNNSGVRHLNFAGRRGIDSPAALALRALPSWQHLEAALLPETVSSSLCDDQASRHGLLKEPRGSSAQKSRPWEVAISLSKGYVQRNGQVVVLGFGSSFVVFNIALSSAMQPTTFPIIAFAAGHAVLVASSSPAGIVQATQRSALRAREVDTSPVLDPRQTSCTVRSSALHTCPVVALLLTPVPVPPRLLPNRHLQPLRPLRRGNLVPMPRLHDQERLQRRSHPLRGTGSQCRRDVHLFAALLRVRPRRGNGDWRHRRLGVTGLPGRPEDVCGGT